MEKGFVKSTIHNNIGEITFFHPKSNSLPSSLLDELAKAIKLLACNDAVKVIALKSDGEQAFCAGASFDDLLNITTPKEGTKFFKGFAKVIAEMKNAPQFIVTSVQGKVVGGGVGVVAASDFVIAYESASVKLSELSIGIGPFVIGPVLKRKLNVSSFMHLTLQPKVWMPSSWSLDRGLFNKVTGDKQELNLLVKEKCTELANYSKDAMLKIKRMSWEGYDNIVEDMFVLAADSGRLVLSDFTKTALNAFKQR